MKGRTLITSAVARMIFQMPRQIWTAGWGGRRFKHIAASYYLTKLWGRLNEYIPSHSEDIGFESELRYRLNWQWSCTTSLSPDRQIRLGIKLEQASATKQKRNAIFWVITQRVVGYLTDVSGQHIGLVFNGREFFQFIINSKLQALTL